MLLLYSRRFDLILTLFKLENQASNQSHVAPAKLDAFQRNSESRSEKNLMTEIQSLQQDYSLERRFLL